MPHADTSILPKSVKSKKDLWAHIYSQLQSLFEGQRHWVSNLANSSSLIYSSLLEFPAHFGDADRKVNWCGFYIDAAFFPTPCLAQGNSEAANIRNKLLLGPFCGKPACQYITTASKSSRPLGVCGDAFVQRRTLLVPDVEAYPGHIACDGQTKSELVCPLVLGDVAVGVLDLDCLAHAGFDEDDVYGAERIAELIVNSCDW